MTPRAGPSFALPLVAMLFGGLAYLALIDASVVTAGGVFEYPLDDTYIHLAMAEQLAQGGYGVNSGEYAAASSSPLFSVLLMPLAGQPEQRLLPVFWNAFGLIVSLFLWGRILWQAGWGNSLFGYLVAAAGPIALNVVGVAFVGMEHALHVAASLAIVSGLIKFVDEGRIGILLIAGVILAPLLRFEGVALAGLAGLFVMARGRYVVGFGLGLLAVVPLAGFAAWLVSLGLEPLPSSVTAKLAMQGGPTSGFSAFVSDKMQSWTSKPPAAALFALLLGGVILLFVPRTWMNQRAGIVIVMLLALVAHLLAGRIGWMDRYEIYILVACAAGLFAASAPNLRLAILPSIPVVIGAIVYLPFVVNLYPDAPRSVALQQAQMARFAKEFWRAPVAVNDLGYVAWQNPDYVLDLWGLANHEARQERLFGTDRLWAAKLVEKHDIDVAMIYEGWFPGQLGDDWQLLGRLRLQVSIAYLAGDSVSFFLTNDGDATPVINQLEDWAAGLPEGVVFEFEGESG